MNKEAVKKVDVIPFYLTNQDNEEVMPFYLYKIGSPCLNEDLASMVTFQLVGEKTRKEDPKQKVTKSGKHFPNQDALIKVLMRRQNPDVSVSSFLKTSVLRINNVDLVEREHNMPMWEDNSYVTRSFIVGLRDSIRWSEYRFVNGSVVDILISPTKFGLFELTETDDNGLKFIPKAVYSCNDPGMTNPLNVDLKTIPYPKEVFGNNPNRPSIINRAVRSAEWRALC